MTVADNSKNDSLLPLPNTPRSGCLLINLGSPNQASKREIRRFLRRFLSDRRVVNWPAWIWKPILHTVVLGLRPRRIQPTYQHIWTPKGSPLVVHTQAQAAHLQAQLPEVMVRYAFSYSNPLIEQVLAEFAAAEVQDLTIIPLYPQYAPSTVSATIDQVHAYYAKQPYLPQLRIITAWPTNSSYINWYAQNLAEQLHAHPVDSLVFSYHSVPDVPAHAPAEYRQQCQLTSDAIVAALQNLYPHPLPQVLQTYQSKFGPGQWITPATIETMAKLPAQGAKRVLVATPGFISDCIETVDEIDILNRAAFMEAGGSEFYTLAPPNSESVTGQILKELYESVN